MFRGPEPNRRGRSSARSWRSRSQTGGGGGVVVAGARRRKFGNALGRETLFHRRGCSAGRSPPVAPLVPKLAAVGNRGGWCVEAQVWERTWEGNSVSWAGVFR